MTCLSPYAILITEALNALSKESESTREQLSYEHVLHDIFTESVQEEAKLIAVALADLGTSLKAEIAKVDQLKNDVAEIKALITNTPTTQPPAPPTAGTTPC